jgi:hypothetical protein
VTHGCFKITSAIDLLGGSTKIDEIKSFALVLIFFIYGILKVYFIFFTASRISSSFYPLNGGTPVRRM